MKALGIVRRIDNLGRVVIPMEVRKTQGWDAHQPLEMFMTDQGLLIRSYGSDLKTEEVVRSLRFMEVLSDDPEDRAAFDRSIELIRSGVAVPGAEDPK